MHALLSAVIKGDTALGIGRDLEAMKQSVRISLAFACCGMTRFTQAQMILFRHRTRLIN
jgi:hypothetical protein